MPITLLVTADPASSYLKPLEKLPDETNIIVSRDREKVLASAPAADVLLNGDFTSPALFLEAFTRAAKMRWAHVLSAGVESVLSPEIRASAIPLTNGRGVFARPLGEWVAGVMVYFAYDFRRMLNNQAERRWQRYDHEELYGRTVAIVGYGSIGRAVGDRAAAMGMRVLTHSRSNPGNLDAMLAECDYLVVTAPLTAETRGLIGAAQIAHLKSNAVVINVGRGAVIDEDALLAALQNNKIRGAALDVFVKEPLPSDHPFWAMQNVIVSPHSADSLPDSREQSVEFFVENFHRFAEGEPLQNIVDKHAGY
jgi:phosphoglycerate dehydrogenase-like enzyme